MAILSAITEELTQQPSQCGIRKQASRIDTEFRCSRRVEMKKTADQFDDSFNSGYAKRCIENRSGSFSQFVSICRSQERYWEYDPSVLRIKTA